MSFSIVIKIKELFNAIIAPFMGKIWVEDNICIPKGHRLDSDYFSCRRCSFTSLDREVIYLERQRLLEKDKQRAHLAYEKGMQNYYKGMKK